MERRPTLSEQLSKSHFRASASPDTTAGPFSVAGDVSTLASTGKKTPPWKDWLLLAGELAARQIYWRSPRLRAWVKRRRSHRRHPLQIADREKLKEYLRSIGVVEGALVMAHTSTAGLKITTQAPGPSAAEGDRGSSTTNPLQVTRHLLDDLQELVGESGTLVMPTNAAYQSQNEYCGPADGTLQRYDPTSTPCAVGLANELFWRSPGTQRSLHPYNMLAARGPLAAELLHDNLNEHKPLPHGIYSGYYRFCQKNGLVISIGVPLGLYMTLIHTAEDVRDQEWPVPGFFEEKRYLVRVESETKEWTVRQRRIVYGKFCFCIRKFVRDLLREGILHEGVVGSVRVDWARARDVFDFLMHRNRLSPYPYYGTRFVGKTS